MGRARELALTLAVAGATLLVQLPIFDRGIFLLDEGYMLQLADAINQADTARRRALLEEAERVMLADHPLLPIYFYVNKHLIKPNVRGWTDNVVNIQYSHSLSLEARQ